MLRQVLPIKFQNAVAKTAEDYRKEKLSLLKQKASLEAPPSTVLPTTHFDASCAMERGKAKGKSKKDNRWKLNVWLETDLVMKRLRDEVTRSPRRSATR